VNSITSGNAAKWQVTPGTHRLDIVLGDVAGVLPKGHEPRLSLENLNIRRNRDNAHLFAAPYFENVGFENVGAVHRKRRGRRSNASRRNQLPVEQGVRPYRSLSRPP